jgi:hypothetical protein
MDSHTRLLVAALLVAPVIGEHAPTNCRPVTGIGSGTIIQRRSQTRVVLLRGAMPTTVYPCLDNVCVILVTLQAVSS